MNFPFLPSALRFWHINPQHLYISFVFWCGIHVVTAQWGYLGMATKIWTHSTGWSVCWKVIGLLSWVSIKWLLCTPVSSSPGSESMQTQLVSHLHILFVIVVLELLFANTYVHAHTSCQKMSRRSIIARCSNVLPNLASLHGAKLLSFVLKCPSPRSVQWVTSARSGRS